MSVSTAIVFLALVLSPPSEGSSHAGASCREVAVTFDDLPVVSAPANTEAAWCAITRTLVDTLHAEKIPAVGFVNGSKLYGEDGPEHWREDLLRVWLEAGLELGNHTFSHPDLHATALEDYLVNIETGDLSLRPLLVERGLAPRWFRHPMLHTGRDAQTRSAIEHFLSQRGYTIAPVTIDHSEWIFARAYAEALKRGDATLADRVRDAYLPYMEGRVDYFERQSCFLLGREVRQVLLLHANQLNADTLPYIVEMLRRRGYKFVTLDRALEDEAYRLPDGYFGRAGISWLHRWCFASGGRQFVLPGEEACPQWLMSAAGVDSE